jgi:uncharacterized protein (TIGR03086 family)
MAPLTRALQLLGSASGYALASTAMVTPQLLSRPSPCPGWDLAMLLDHLADSVDVLHQTISGESIGARTAPRRSDPIPRLHRQLLALASTAGAGPARRTVAIWDRELTANMVAVAGAIEITVHGWDIAVACGGNRPIPPGLAAVLLATAPLLVPADSRPGLFGDPVPLLGPASPGDELLAFLGRRPVRGDSEGSTWSA